MPERSHARRQPPDDSPSSVSTGYIGVTNRNLWLRAQFPCQPGRRQNPSVHYSPIATSIAFADASRGGDVSAVSESPPAIRAIGRARRRDDADRAGRVRAVVAASGRLSPVFGEYALGWQPGTLFIVIAHT
jgi:hypothetical protein